MEVNPYQPPVVATPTLADEQNANALPAPRPIGIWILSVLHLLVGLLLLVMTLFVIWIVSTGRENRFGFPLWFVVVVCGLMALLALSTSIGMWLGARWGWWLTAFYYVWGGLGVVADFLLVVWRLGELDYESIVQILPGKLTQFAVHALILLYLFKETVRDFFRLNSLRLSYALTILAIIAIGVLTATFFAAHLQPAVGL